MGFSKAEAIRQANRNEAHEAQVILNKVQIDLIDADYPNSFKLAKAVQNAIDLIEKYQNKHEAPSTWELK